MSYLNPLRLHFAGKFQAAPSTVNNDITNFNTKQPQLDGEWNPRGDAAWRLIGCNVTSAWQADGSPVDPGDMILTCLIADSDRQAPAKLVDLDPEQQMVSAIWGLEVRICDANGNTLLRGQFETASFMDLWVRAQSKSGGDFPLGAIYQSTLKNLEWGTTEQSPFLMALQAAAQDGLLSIKFNVDGYDRTPGSANFTMGRVGGTIGPATASEPTFFTVGRQFLNVDNAIFCVGVVDQMRGKILLDLGNALPTTFPGGPLKDMGTLSLAYAQQPPGGGPVQWVPIDTIPYSDAGWYERTAGVVELPVSRSLTSQELESIGTNVLALLLPGSDGNPTPMTMEAKGGLHVRPDQFVFRMSPGDQMEIQFYATRFGRPYEGAELTLALDPGQLQAGDGWPDPGKPSDKVHFPETVTTGVNGIAIVPIQADDPGNFRQYIDGQVYGVRAMLTETKDDPDFPENPGNFVSLLIWDAFTPDDPPTWWGSLQPIFQQYANLYPVMDSFLNLGDYESVCANAGLLRLAFGLDLENPNSMPVTRDLSPARRAAILHWLQNLGPDGKPLLGTPPSMPISAEVAPKEVAVAPTIRNAHWGGKAAAASRRLALRSSNAK